MDASLLRDRRDDWEPEMRAAPLDPDGIGCAKVEVSVHPLEGKGLT